MAPRCNKLSGEIKPEHLYLTVEQVRRAAACWIMGQFMRPLAQQQYYQRTADIITYYQGRNQLARKYHCKRTLRRLIKLGINVNKLKSCVPYESK